MATRRLWNILLAASLGYFCVRGNAFAVDTRIGNVLCTTSDWFTGNTGKGIGTVAVTIIGIWKLIGKISGREALICLAGIALLFGAPQIINSMNAGANPNCHTNGF